MASAKSALGGKDESVDEVMDEIFGGLGDDDGDDLDIGHDDANGLDGDDLDLTLDDVLLDEDSSEAPSGSRKAKDPGAVASSVPQAPTAGSGSTGHAVSTGTLGQSRNEPDGDKDQEKEKDTTWVSLDSSEKDNFLSWLGEDEADLEPSALQQRGSRSPTIESSASDTGLSFSLEHSSSLTSMLNTPSQTDINIDLPPFNPDPMTPEEIKQLSLYPPGVLHPALSSSLTPSSSARTKAPFLRWLFPEGDALLGESTGSGVEEQLKVLLKLDLSDTSPIVSALTVGDNGLVLPFPNPLRFRYWLKLLCTKTELAALESSATETNTFKPFNNEKDDIGDGSGEGWREAYRSLVPGILKAAGWPVNEETESKVEGILAEFCRLRLQATYHPLVADILCVVLRASGTPQGGLQDAQVVQAMLGVSDRWGGEKGNWSSTGMFATPQPSGVGGMAFAADTLPSVQMRRHLLLRLLLLHHDPALGLHLDRCIASWDILKTVNPLDPAFRRISLAAESFYPSVPLFGLFSVIRKANHDDWHVPVDRMMLLWDALILKRRGFENPQIASFFLAAALLVLNRDEILQCDTNDKLRSMIDELPKQGFADETSTHGIIWLASAMANASPQTLRQLLAEDELLISLPGAQQTSFAIEEDEPVDSGSSPNEDGPSPSQSPPISTDNTEASETEAKTTAPKSTTSWLTPNLRQLQQRFAAKSKATSPGSESAVPIGEDSKQELVVFYSLDKNPGLVLSNTSASSGLRVKRLVKDSEAARSAIRANDLLMTVNGHLVLNLSPADALQFIAMQDRPLYCIVSRPGGSSAGHGDGSGSGHSGSEGIRETTVPGLRYRLLKYYLAYNTNKLHSVDKILDLYHGHEAVLLEELRIKYKAHVLGDPHVLPLSQLCPEVSATEVVKALFEEEAAGDVVSEALPRRYFVIDCRSRPEVEDTGSFPTAFKLDYTLLESDELEETLRPLRGKKHICLMSSGQATLFEEYYPKAAREMLEKERRRIDRCALYLLRKGFPYVCIVEGGLLACYMAIVNGAFSLQDCLVKADPSASIRTSRLLKRYETYMMYKQGRGMSPSELLGKVAKHQKEPRRRSSSTTSVTREWTPYDAPSLHQRPSQMPKMTMPTFSKFLNTEALSKPDLSTAKWPSFAGFSAQRSSSAASTTGEGKEKGTTSEKAGEGGEKLAQKNASAAAWKAWEDMSKALPSKEQLSQTLNTAINNSTVLLGAASQAAKPFGSSDDTAELYSVDDNHGRREKVSM